MIFTISSFLKKGDTQGERERRRKREEERERQNDRQTKDEESMQLHMHGLVTYAKNHIVTEQYRTICICVDAHPYTATLYSEYEDCV